eukprot:COSAG02_NODE_58144_length_278_cov_0.849162_1_plen_60_part_01
MGTRASTAVSFTNYHLDIVPVRGFGVIHYHHESHVARRVNGGRTPSPLPQAIILGRCKQV